MTLRVRGLATLMLVLLNAACAAPPPGATTSSTERGSAQAPATPITRTLVMAGRAEAPSVASRPLRSFGLASGAISRLFNAGLTLRDGDGNFRPYLAEALPELNTDSWKVLPDGRMETTYRLRPNLVWHDGTPLTAHDFSFAYQVYAHPDIGQASSLPMTVIETVTAPDPQTLLIRWRAPFAEAGNLDAGGGLTTPIGLPPLPRHLLEQQLNGGNVESFISLPFWTTDYVGLGPYQLDRWEPGAYLEGVAFDRHVLGRPRIERVRMLFIPDFNTTLANMLAGEAHITVDDSIRFEQAMVLKREWDLKNSGTILMYPSFWRYVQIQQRAELARPSSLLDVRVRRALASATDKVVLDAVMFEGHAILTETSIPPTSPAFAEGDRIAMKYPYDVRRTEQLLAETGYSRAPNGVWTHPSMGRFEIELTVLQSPSNEREMHITADSWRQAGFDVEEKVWPSSLASDQRLRGTHPSLGITSTTPGEATLVEHNAMSLPSPSNRWVGSNRGGWSNAEFDVLADRYNTTLAPRGRVALLVQMTKIFTEDAASISLYFVPSTTAVVSNLKGPRSVTPEGTVAWDIHEWEWTS